MTLAGTVDTFGLPLTDHQTSAPIPTSIQSQFQVNIGQDGTGIYTDNHSGHLVGLLDDFGIWRRALTAREVGAIYIAGMAGKDLSQVTTPEAIVHDNFRWQCEFELDGRSDDQIATGHQFEAGQLDGCSWLLRSQFSDGPSQPRQAFFRLSQ